MVSWFGRIWRFLSERQTAPWRPAHKRSSRSRRENAIWLCVGDRLGVPAPPGIPTSTTGCTPTDPSSDARAPLTPQTAGLQAYSGRQTRHPRRNLADVAREGDETLAHRGSPPAQALAGTRQANRQKQECARCPRPLPLGRPAEALRARARTVALRLRSEKQVRHILGP